MNMEALSRALLRTDNQTIGKYVTFVRFSKKQKQRKDDTRSKYIHLRTLIQKKDITPSERALHYFNIYYKKFYGQAWHSIRLALLSRPKHVALVNNFCNAKETEHKLALQGCFNIFPDYIAANQSPKEPYFGERVGINEDNEESENSEGLNANELSSMEKDMVNERLIAPHQKISLRGESFESMFGFVPVSELQGMEDFVEESEQYVAYSKIDSEKEFPLQFWKEDFRFTPLLKAYAFPRGDITRFPAPSPGLDNHYDYYCLDGSSLLPVLALNVQKGNAVLDLCSGPGGKALAITQTLMASKLVCNDSSWSRVKRVRNVFHQYFGGQSPYEGLEIEFTCADGEDYFMENESAFDRVLCDVPCFTDRVVIREDENNIFNPRKSKERIRLPELQINLLKSALLSVKPGGYVVYSTCSLSPSQNDGVVHSVLKELWEDGKLEFAVCDLSQAVEPLKDCFKFAEDMRYGQQVIPILYNNFGPMYFSKIKRLHSNF